MTQTQWPVTADGKYVIDATVGNLELQPMIDLGLTDPAGQVGFALDPTTYDLLKRAGQLTKYRARLCRDASGRFSTIECALTTAHLIHPTTRRQVGPVVRVFVSRGVTAVPNRVGVPFFHLLTGCRIVWNLADRTWCVECS